jgi:hypothetical protein
MDTCQSWHWGGESLSLMRLYDQQLTLLFWLFIQQLGKQVTATKKSWWEGRGEDERYKNGVKGIEASGRSTLKVYCSFRDTLCFSVPISMVNHPKIMSCFSRDVTYRSGVMPNSDRPTAYPTDRFHGAEPFLRSRQLCSYSRTSQHFMEPEGYYRVRKGPPLSEALHDIS